MSLKPLLDRLKRTDAPTVEDISRWDCWYFTLDGEPRKVRVWLSSDDGRVVSNGGLVASLIGAWVPVPSSAELLALAALPGKVALESALASIAAVESTRATDTDPDDCGECAGIHDGTLSDAVHAINAINPAAIVEECAK